MFAMTVFMTALLWVAFGSHTPTHALGPASASWKGESILYDGHQYFNAGDTKSGNSLGLPQGAHYYVYIPEATTGAVTPSKAYVLYFAPGTDPPTEKTVSSATYDYVASTKKYSNPTDKKTVDLTVKGSGSSYSSCTVQGIGWIICPVAVFMADSMDNIFTFVSQFFVVPPVTVNDSNSSLYIAWNMIRGIANIAFIIAFLIIIYSQLTSTGISNYGLKKLLPRLILAAILVNVSFLVCSIAVDISNVLGYSLQDIFVQIRKNTFNITNESWSASTTTWTTLTAFVLSGGAIGYIGVAVAGDLVGALPVLLPILLGVVLICLVVLLILAARQAIIVILIVIAPLAFVAYLLPNTEKWFEKWRELFMTMLIFFPAFSLVFGGSQLAGGLIIQNASSVIMIIFGLAVQVAPLVITPLLLKLSGGVLGKIAGLVNDPRKGIVDRAKNWSKDRTNMNRSNSLKKTNSANPFRRIAQRLDNSDRNVKERTALYDTQNDNRYNSSAQHAKNHEDQHEADVDKGLIENRLNAHTVKSATIRGSTLNIKSLELENSKVELESATSAESAMYAEYRSGKAKTGGDERLKAIRKSMSSHVMENSVQLQRKQSAESKQVELFAKQMENSTSMRKKAGGVLGETGAQRALAVAISAQSKAHSEAVSNAASILTHYNYSDAMVNDIALGDTSANIKVKITNDIIEAAIGKIAGGNNTAEIVRLMENIKIDDTPATLDFRQTYSDTLLANSSRPKFASAGMLSNAKQGIDIPPPGPGRIDEFVLAAVNADKFGSADLLVSQDNEYLKAVSISLGRIDESKFEPGKRETIKKSIELARKNDLYAGKIGERKDTLDEIYKQL